MYGQFMTYNTCSHGPRGLCGMLDVAGRAFPDGQACSQVDPGVVDVFADTAEI